MSAEGGRHSDDDIIPIVNNTIVGDINDDDKIVGDVEDTYDDKGQQRVPLEMSGNKNKEAKVSDNNNRFSNFILLLIAYSVIASTAALVLTISNNTSSMSCDCPSTRLNAKTEDVVFDGFDNQTLCNAVNQCSTKNGTIYIYEHTSHHNCT